MGISNVPQQLPLKFYHSNFGIPKFDKNREVYEGKMAGLKLLSN